MKIEKKNPYEFSSLGLRPVKASNFWLGTIAHKTGDWG